MQGGQTGKWVQSAREQVYDRKRTKCALDTERMTRRIKCSRTDIKYKDVFLCERLDVVAKRLDAVQLDGIVQ